MTHGLTDRLGLTGGNLFTVDRSIFGKFLFLCLSLPPPSLSPLNSKRKQVAVD